MRALQRALGERMGAVMEGRDIGTVIFPDASVKIFVTADPKEREERRAGERDAAVVEVAEALHARDARDAAVNPPVPAPDAIVLDTTNLDADETLARALTITKQRRG